MKANLKKYRLLASNMKFIVKFVDINTIEANTRSLQKEEMEKQEAYKNKPVDNEIDY